MSVRTILILLALPLFLLLAGVNSLLLYREETQDMEIGMRGEALAAAVTVAEFAKITHDPFADLAAPRRLAALRDAAARIPGLAALYLTAPSGRTISLVDRPASIRPGLAAPPAPRVIGTWRDNMGAPLITAIAPAGHGTVIVADIDAEPLARRTFHLKRLSITLIAGSAALALLLGLIVSRRVSREFRRTRSIIAARGGESDDAPLGIREVRDLADAIRLIDISVTSELDELGRGASGDLAVGIAAIRARRFPDLSIRCGDLAISIRTQAGAAPGCFHICRTDAGRCLIAIGEVEGAPVEALASAVAIRDLLDTAPIETFEAALERAIDGFGVVSHKLIRWPQDPLQPIALHDPHGAIAAYARRNPDLDPDALTADLTILFPDAGVIVAAGMS